MIYGTVAEEEAVYENVWVQNLTDGCSKVESTESSKDMRVYVMHDFLLGYMPLISRCLVD